MSRPTIAELVVGDEPAAWQRLGFSVDGDVAVVGATSVRLAGGGGGLSAWSLRDAQTTRLDGLETTICDLPPAARVKHPNGALLIDHVVVSTPDLPRTLAAFGAGGLKLRRVREHSETLHQGFFRLGQVVVEVAGPPQRSGNGPACFWGLVAVVPDVDALADRLDAGLLGTPRAAVQEGRRIVTVTAAAGLTVALAFLTP